MTQLSGLPDWPSGHAPLVRPAYRVLGRAHYSVTGLFVAAETLDSARREANESTKGRKASAEIDVVRSAIILSSAGLDASMTRLVKDVGGSLVRKPSGGARRQFEEYLKRELAKPKVSDSFRAAVLDADVADALVQHYLTERTRASFQGSGDLKVRVRQTLGISSRDVTDDELSNLDEFFTTRNKIAHDMDLKDPASHSVAREHRDAAQAARQCDQVFAVAVRLINGAARACRRS